MAKNGFIRIGGQCIPVHDLEYVEEPEPLFLDAPEADLMAATYTIKIGSETFPLTPIDPAHGVFAAPNGQRIHLIERHDP